MSAACRRTWLGAWAPLLWLAQAARADEPPPAPPEPPARVVVEAAASATRVRLALEGHAARLTPEPEGLLTLESSTPGQARWDPLAYDASAGGRVRATFEHGRRALETSFTWWGSWSDEQPTTGSLASTATPTSPLNVVSAIGIGLREDATLWDFALRSQRSWRAAPCLAGAWGVGARYLRLDEEASFLFPTSVPPANAAVFTTELEAGLLAVEVGATAAWSLAPRLDLVARGAAFAGWMRRNGSLATTNVSPVPGEGGRGRDDLGYGAEAELALCWRAAARLTLTVGAGALWLGPVTRAHEALDFSNVSSNDLGPRFPDDTLLVPRVFAGLVVEF